MGNEQAREHPENSPQNNFFLYVNGDWLKDESIKIPEEYPIWGSFQMLRDESLKAQIEIMKEVAAKYQGDKRSLSDEEKCLAQVYLKSLARFEQWSTGKGDYSMLSLELDQLATSITGTGEEFRSNLAQYFAKSERMQISSPVSFFVMPNLKDSGNNILQVGKGGLSLPSRDYYFEANFQKQREMFLDHLQKVETLLKSDESIKLGENFAAAVMRFEKKLAQINMTSAQSRKYDLYFTLTTIDGLATGINTHNHLAEKDDLYKEGTEFDGDADSEILTKPGYTVSDEHKEEIKDFIGKLMDEMDVEKSLQANYKEHYGQGSDDDINKLAVFDGDYFRRVFKLLFAEHNREDLKAYLQYKLIRASSSYCTKDLDEEVFDFYSRKLSGKKAQPSDEKRTVNLVNAWLGMALGKLYVAKHFSEEHKENVKSMIGDVTGVMESSIQMNDWLTPPTKEAAVEKLSKFKVKIGYPDKWRTYDGLSFSDDDTLFAMMRKVAEFEYKKDFLDDLNTPKDATKWGMTPQTVNAYFSPLNNEIVFPASILQPPFYNREVSDLQFRLDCPRDTPGLVTAANYGGIGAVIAHEITHGFDDQGRKFDGEGNMRDWWVKEDEERFLVKANMINAQADEYKFEDIDATTGQKTIHRMNGKLCTGENLADLGGLSLGVQAMLRNLHHSNAVIHASRKKIHLQVFFCSWACVWKSKTTKEYKIKKLATDPHAPEDFRGNLVRNIPYYYEAWTVKSKDKMYLKPEDRVVMW